MGWTSQFIQQLIIEAGAPGQGVFIYDGVPGLGTLFASFTATAGVDPFGNITPGGLNLIGLPNVTNILTVTDTSGNTLFSVDSSGNINTVGNVTVGGDIILAGNSLTAELATLPQGMINYGYQSNAGNWPSGSVGTTETALFELDQAVIAGRVYELFVNPTIVVVTNAGAVVHLYLRYTTDGSTPSTASTLATSIAVNCPVAASAQGIAGLRCPFFPTVTGEYRFLVTGNVSAGTFQFASADPFVRFEVDDLGTFTQTNNLIAFGTGSGGGASKQQYTETFYPNHTYSYYSNSGLRNTDGSMYHGAYSGEAPNYQYSYIGWGAGSLGTASLSVLLGGAYTINWAKLRLCCIHSWYNSGMLWGLHTSTVLGSTGYSTILNPGGTSIGEGATVSNTLGGAQINALFAAGAYTVLAPDSGDLTNLSWYGYFQGGGGSAGLKPAITVNYTH
jgi:hypothetical protein